jgi:hypothetical protein
MAGAPEKCLCCFEALARSVWREGGSLNGERGHGDDAMPTSHESDRSALIFRQYPHQPPATMIGRVSMPDRSFAFGLSDAFSKRKLAYSEIRGSLKK